MSTINHLKTAKMSDEEFNNLVDLVFEHTSIRMNSSKRHLLINRLSRRLRELGIDSYQQYYLFIKSPKGKSELGSFIDSVTTNETYFYRAPKIWDYFYQEYLPEWYNSLKIKKPLKMWCSASSSGEEPYTIGIFCEEFKSKHKDFSWSLAASDISNEMITRCKTGIYSGRSISKLKPIFLKKYFSPLPNEEYEVQNTIKKNINFFTHRLQDNPKGRGFDIIFLRNVMIYFDKEVKEIVLKQMEKAINPGGILVIGESEGLVNLDTNFKYIKPSIYCLEKK